MDRKTKAEVDQIFNEFTKQVKEQIKSYEKTLPRPDAPPDVVDKYMKERDDYSIGSVVYYTMYRELVILHYLNVLYGTLQLSKPKGKSILHVRAEVEKLRQEMRRLKEADRKTEKVRNWFSRFEKHNEPTETLDDEP